MAAYLDGDGRAFGEIVRRYAASLLRFMRRGLYQPSDAEDLVQQTFLHVHRARSDFDMGERLVPWLFAIGLNVKRDYLRGRRRRSEHSQAAAEATLSGARDPDSERFAAERDLELALSQLPAAHREVIELHWFSGLSFPEVAQTLGDTTTAVKVRAHRGYVKLRELLATKPSS